jgi:hypothetical protein
LWSLVTNNRNAAVRALGFAEDVFIPRELVEPANLSGRFQGKPVAGARSSELVVR